jgi:hypothetical protein
MRGTTLTPLAAAASADVPYRNPRGERRDQRHARWSATRRPPASPATTRPLSANAPQRTGASQRNGALSRCDEVRYPLSSSSVAVAKPHCPSGLDERFVSHSAAPASARAARLVRERAAMRGRIATEGGDKRAGAKKGHPFECPALVVSRRNARGERRDQGRARSSMSAARRGMT